MKNNKYHFPNCNSLLDTKTFSGKYTCPTCDKQYITTIDFLRGIPFILVIVILPSILFDNLVGEIDFIEHKFLISTILIFVYAFILIISGATSFIEEKKQNYKMERNYRR